MKSVVKSRMGKILSLLLAAVVVCSVLAGCGTDGAGGDVTISVGNWPDKEAKNYESMEALRLAFMEANPNIKVETDTYVYDISSFVAKAASGQLPTIFNTHFTEVNKIVDNGFARDITKQAAEYNMDSNMNPMLLSMVEKDGKIYAVPKSSYAMGLFINNKMFKQAGLVDENGEIKIPKNYTEVAEYGKIIKGKTGKSGFMISTTNNCGGWHFMNIAWSNGVSFMEQDGDNWKAKFDSKECIDSLQYIKDLRWEYDILTPNLFVDGTEIQKLFASGETAMIFLNPPGSGLSSGYGMNKDDITIASMPAGSEGRYSQIGGTVYMIESGATDAETSAALKWLDYIGALSNFGDEQINSWETTAKNTIESGGFVLPKEAFSIWVNEDRAKAYNEAISKYINVDPKNSEDYFSFKDVISKAEEPQSAQDLYNILDGCIQEVITNKDADPAKLIKEAAAEFQKNHLDKIGE